MPELPEVETVRRHLAPDLVGRQIRDVQLFHPDILMGPEHLDEETFGQALRTTAITGLQRRGKRLGFRLSNGRVLETQLRMTGRFHHQDGSPHPPEGWTHLAACFVLTGPSWLFYDDVRRLGGFFLHTSESWEELLASLGPEPLDDEFEVQDFAACFQGSRAALKNALMDQHRMAGIGNIYASEILYRSRLSPTRPAGRLADPEWKKLYHTTRAILREALKYRGTTIRDFQPDPGETGSFQERLAVYGREGEACRRCGTTLQRIKQAGRSTFFCPQCQKAPET